MGSLRVAFVLVSLLVAVRAAHTEQRQQLMDFVHQVAQAESLVGTTLARGQLEVLEYLPKHAHRALYQQAKAALRQATAQSGTAATTTTGAEHTVVDAATSLLLQMAEGARNEPKLEHVFPLPPNPKTANEAREPVIPGHTLTSSTSGGKGGGGTSGGGGGGPGAAAAAGDPKLAETLGAGAFGKVYKAKSTVDHKEYALKLVTEEKAADTLYTEVVTYVKAWAKKLERPKYVITYHSAVVAPTDSSWDRATYEVWPLSETLAVSPKRLRGLVLEYCAQGDLAGLVAEFAFSFDEFPFWWRENFVAQAFHGLWELHRGGFNHRDVKPENIMICGVTGSENTPFAAKVGDLGLAAPIKQAHHTTVAQLFAATHPKHPEWHGTPLFAAPELFDVGHAPGLYDMYAMGLTAVLVLGGSHGAYSEWNTPKTILDWALMLEASTANEAAFTKAWKARVTKCHSILHNAELHLKPLRYPDQSPGLAQLLRKCLACDSAMAAGADARLTSEAAAKELRSLYPHLFGSDAAHPASPAATGAAVVTSGTQQSHPLATSQQQHHSATPSGPVAH